MDAEAAPTASAEDVSRSFSNSRGVSVDQDASDAADLANATSAHQWQQAVHEFTTALKFVLTGGEAEAAVLNQRSAALCRLSEFIRSIPARTSERRAMYHHDPAHLAQLALKDAEKAALIKPTWPELYARQGEALTLLERYSDAESAFLEGLALQPTDSTLKLLHEPVTTPCGHTFCRGCFSRSMDHNNKCPMCRTVLHVGRELPVTITLQNIISKAFPEEAEARAAETKGVTTAEAALAAVEEVTLPLFVMSTLLPGEKMALNIFEPRYRLMARRCMEGNRRFGMAQGSGEEGDEAGLSDAGNQPAAAGAGGGGGGSGVTPGETIPELVAEVVGSCEQLMERLRSIMAGRRMGAGQIRELLDRLGDLPSRSDAEGVSWWASRMLLLITPSNSEGWIRRELMALTDTKERLQMLQRSLQQRMRDSGSASCSIM
eukprot:gene12534-12667_t